MALSGGYSRAVILQIDGGGVNVMLWQKQSLSIHARYQPKEVELDAFSKFVFAHDKWPYIIVADFIEEDFRNETVAHVTGADRRSLLERKLTFSFRNTIYRTAKVTGREKEGRRDDMVLYSALTKPELLSPWIDRILNVHGAIRAVTSAAYLTELLYKALRLKGHEHLLVASLENSSGLRQTYLHNGRVQFSRLSPLNVADDRGFSAALKEQCEQTRKYLERIKLLPYGDLLRIEVIAPQYEDDPELSAVPADYMHFEFIDSDQLQEKKLLNMGNHEIGAVALALGNALKSRNIQNVYGPQVLRRYLHIQRAEKLLYMTGTIALLASLTISTPRLITSYLNWEERSQVQSQSRLVTEELSRLREGFPDTPIPSSAMALVVETSDRIVRRAYTFQEFLYLISPVLMNASELKLMSINWQLEVLQSQDEIDAGAVPYVQEGTIAGLEMPPREELIKAVVAGRTGVAGTLRGVVQEAVSHRRAHVQVLDFIAGLEALPEVSGVEQVLMPLDIRSDSQVATNLDGQEVTAEFVLRVRLEKPL